MAKAKQTRQRTPKLTPEAVIKNLWKEAVFANSESVRVTALRALAEYYGLVKGAGQATDTALPELPILIEVEGEGDAD